ERACTFKELQTETRRGPGNGGKRREGLGLLSRDRAVKSRGFWAPNPAKWVDPLSWLDAEKAPASAPLRGIGSGNRVSLRAAREAANVFLKTGPAERGVAEGQSPEPTGHRELIGIPAQYCSARSLLRARAS